MQCEQEVQDSHAWLKRTYAALDEQAAQTGQESIDRYLLNSALLSQLFSGPGPLLEPLGEARWCTWRPVSWQGQGCMQRQQADCWGACRRANGRDRVGSQAEGAGVWP